MCTDVNDSDPQINPIAKASTPTSENKRKQLRRLTIRGQNSRPQSEEGKYEGMTTKQIAKMKQVDRKRMQMLEKRREKDSSKRNQMRANRGALKPRYGSRLPPPPPPPHLDMGHNQQSSQMMEEDQY